MNGILLINKPKDYTSHDIVAVIKRLTNEKVGHTGTLDPNATGVLPLLVGRATGLSKYLINHDKIYIATLKLGIKTDTADGEGNVIEEKKIPNINEEKINHIFKEMLGEQNQVPPMYSAIKINGKKLYEYARSGRTVEIEPRKITIYDMKLVEYNKTNNEIIFKISCSKGTYIRTVCENVAEKLDTVGYMKELERLKVGEFSIENSVGIEQIKEDPSIIEQNIITIEKYFNNKKNINLTEIELNIFLNGGKLTKILENDIYNIYVKEKYIGIGRIENNNLKRDIVI
jgi:tRNA pseudouridine55 synthase